MQQHAALTQDMYHISSNTITLWTPCPDGKRGSNAGCTRGEIVLVERALLAGNSIVSCNLLLAGNSVASCNVLLAGNRLEHYGLLTAATLDANSTIRRDHGHKRSAGVNIVKANTSQRSSLSIEIN